jgi:tetratricopeptide (TPR) repeat protein
MRHYAWVELQRGVLKLRQGRFADAWAHYDRADRAYSGYWLVGDHKAECLGAQGKFAEAAALYERVVERVPRPEYQQALGELYELTGQPEEAAAWNERALAAYLSAADRGGVHYYHHLVDFYADVQMDGREAVKWARKDIELRRNFSTLSALAWALYRAGEFAEALATMNQALASGATDAHLFYQAAQVHQSVSGNGDGERYLRRAAELNPHYRSFHVHR